MSAFKNALKVLTDSEGRNADRAKLCSTKRLRDITDPELRAFLKPLYARRETKMKVLACVLNAVFTEFKGTFLFSKTIVSDLISSDSNLRRKSELNGDEYKDVWIKLTGGVQPVFKILRKGSPGSELAAVLELSQADLLSSYERLVGKEFCKLQTEHCLNVFDSCLNTEKPNYLPKLPTKSTPDGEGGYDNGSDDGEKTLQPHHHEGIERNAEANSPPSVTSEPITGGDAITKLLITRDDVRATVQELADTGSKQRIIIDELLEVLNSGAGVFNAKDVAYLEGFRTFLSIHRPRDEGGTRMTLTAKQQKNLASIVHKNLSALQTARNRKAARSRSMTAAKPVMPSAEAKARAQAALAKARANARCS